MDKKGSSSMSKDLEITPFVFVYGTLKRTYNNNYLLHSSTFLQEDTTKDLFVLGQVGIPFAVPKELCPPNLEFKSIKGELYEVNEDTLVNLDILEQNDYLYKREPREMRSGKVAWVYIFPKVQVLRHCTYCNETPEGEFIWQS